MSTVSRPELATMQTRDGIRLDADIYRPEADGTYPVLLMRQPYGRAIASTVVYAHPAWYAAQGYIVVIQDVRGRGTSQGEFQLFINEQADGEDAVNWAAQLPGSSGQVGMYGFSYQGMTQLYAAIARPAALKTICPAMTACDLYADWAYEGGAFCLQANLSWGIQLAAETARLRGDWEAFQALFAASRQLPLYDPNPARPEVIQVWAQDSFYHQWLDHPAPDDYWQPFSLEAELAGLELPMLHIGGWFDPMMRGTLHLYQHMQQVSTAPQHLWVGPWGHLPWGRRVGAIDQGDQAVSLIDHLQIRWFDAFLKGHDRGFHNDPAVNLFELGGNNWRTFLDWPKLQNQVWHLVSNGLASVRPDAGQLVQTKAVDTLPEVEDLLVHDPWRPVPALGGHAAVPSGIWNRAAIDDRTDVLTYTSTPLEKDLHLAGQALAEIWCNADTLSFDLCAVLSEVHPDGSVYNLAQGYCRQDFPVSQPVQIQLQPICAKVIARHALRLSLSAACFPAYPVNPGNGRQPKEASLMESQVITLRIMSGGTMPSRLRLPIVPPP